MDTAIGSFQADKEAAFTPKRGKIKPIEIVSHERRETDEKAVTDLMKALARDGRFLQDIAVRDERATGYRLVFGANRLEAWKRYFGEQVPIPASIYSSNTPDARIAVFESEENLVRNQLTPAERQAEMLRYAAALKTLEGEKLATELPLLGSDAKSATRGGRGKKAATAKMAAKLRLSKTAVQNWTKKASAAIGEEIDLDHDTPEELERKADKRQHAEPKLELPKRIRIVIKRPTSPAKPAAAKVSRHIEDLWKAFDAIDSADQFRFVHDASLRLGLDPLLMASPAVFGLADEEPELAEDLPVRLPRRSTPSR